ncbi:MAG: hypothetical protein WBD95_16250 [Xanthobacteraceae bacterium]
MQVDENDIGVLVVDEIDESRAVRKFDGVDILSAQLLRQVAPECKIIIHYEAKRVSRSPGLVVESCGEVSVGHQ